MRPNEVLQKPPVSVIILQVEALYKSKVAVQRFPCFGTGSPIF
jgi:hypothetical protein